MHNFGVMAQVLLNGESRFLSPCDFKERLVAFVDHPLAGVGNFGAHLEHDALDAVPDRKITTRRAPRSAQPPQQQQHERRDHGGKDQLFERAHPPHGRHSCSSSRFYRFPLRGKLLLRRLALLV